MNPSEIAFLALGLVLGAAVGAALLESVRARPMPRREVRITMSPNSIAPRRSATLASADPDAGRTTIPGSPDDDGWLERRLAGDSMGGGSRTRVPSGPVTVPAAAVAIAVTPGGAGTRPGGAVAVMDPILPHPDGGEPVPPPSIMFAADAESEPMGAAIGIRPRPPGPASRLALPAMVVAVPMDPSVPQPPPAQAMVGAAWVAAAAASDPSPEAGDGPGPGPSDPVAPVMATGSDPSDLRECESERLLVEERCRLAEAARGQARQAADALREGRRAYDILRERVERAQVIADPREVRAAKDALHRAFRDAREAAATPEAAEQAAREWLNEVNRLNTSSREAAHVVEAGSTELRALLPGLERLAVEADAARITAETAEAGCREAREALARCEEAASLAAAAAIVPPAAEEPSARDLAWPTTAESSPLAGGAGAGDEEDRQVVVELSAIVRVLRGDRPARERLVASLAAGDAEAAHQWQLRIAGLVDAITARAIEDGYLDLPDTGFWGVFAHQERREIVGALSALGFRFDGLGGFADGRVPAQRDLSLAVGYAGLDRMRIRIWPREAELAGLYADAAVAADEWLAGQAGDLSLGSMVDALGARAAELADVWNAWGRVRPALLATD